tara:strand:+ start:32 stop:793 length:762 start_codon:yes stop_codon:yes gene_type:complete
VFKIVKICLLGIWNVWFYVLCFIGIAISFPFLILFSLKESWYPQFFWVAKNIWSNTVMYGMGFYPSIKWKQRYKKDKSYMLVSNHKSMIDIMLMLSACDHPVVFVGKKELSRIPIFGYFYSKVCILVDRDNAQSRKDVYAKSAKRLKKGLSICIFPEGGIPEPGIILRDFKDGAFSLAIQFQIPIVPMSFYDCEDKFPYFFAYNYFVGSPGKLRAQVHNFIETKGMTQDDKYSLKQKVFRLMKNDLAKVISQN